MEKIMSLGLLGRKIGMTEVYDDEGNCIPVTVVEIGDNYVTQVKVADVDGYNAIQVTFGERKASRVKKAQIGHVAKAGVKAGVFTTEFRLDESELAQFTSGQAIGVDIFSPGQKLDVQGTTIGKGYAGTIKRHHFSSGRASHGNSRSHNVPGSIGQAQDPGRVFPGKRMTGHLGHVTRTTQSLLLVRIDSERKLLLIKGAIPSAKGGFVVITPAVKARVSKAAAAA
jgi:large subunit ribosomal protein L3